MAGRSFRYARMPVREDAPFSDLNITPLIDVLLVLLVMMILTIPILNHKIPVPLPQPGRTDPATAAVHHVELDAAGRISWDGNPIGDAALPGKLAAFMQEDNAQLQVRADPAARYERFAQTLATIRRAGVTRLGFVGNERFAKFDAPA